MVRSWSFKPHQIVKTFIRIKFFDLSGINSRLVGGFVGCLVDCEILVKFR